MIDIIDVKKDIKKGRLKCFLKHGLIYLENDAGAEFGSEGERVVIGKATEDVLKDSLAYLKNSKRFKDLLGTVSD